MRKFGLEIEVGSTFTADELCRRAGLGGVTVENRTHTHSGNSNVNWVLKYDGSLDGLRAEDGTRLSGFEFVSPPLDFDNEEHRAQIDKLSAVLAETCVPVPQGGVHVHIEAVNDDGRNMDGKQIASVVRFFYKFEDAIYRIASSGWESLRPGARSYAKSLPEDVVREITKARTHQDVRNVWDHGNVRGTSRNYWGEHMDRYFAVNLRSWINRNTIEFRCFNSTVNGKRLQAYVALCMAMVQDARNGHARYVGKNYPLGGMASGAVTEQALMMRLQQVLRSDSRDTHVLMTKEDWKNLRWTCWKDSVPQANIFRLAS